MIIKRLVMAAALLSILLPMVIRPSMARTDVGTLTAEEAKAEAQATVDRLQPIWQQAGGSERIDMAVALSEALFATDRNDDVLQVFAEIGPDEASPVQEERLLLAAIDAASELRSAEVLLAVLPRVGKLTEKGLPADSLVNLWDQLASLQVILGRFSQAEESAQRGIQLAGPVATMVEFSIRKTLAVAQAQQGRIPEAIESMLAAEKAANEAGQPLDVAFLMNFGGMFIYAKDLPRAIQYLERAAATATAPGGDGDRLDGIYSNLGIAHNMLGQLDEAQRNYELAIEAARSRGKSTATGLNNLASVLMERGKVTEAKPILEEVLAMNRAGGDPVAEAITLKNLGEAFIKLGQRKEAADVLEQAHAMQVEFDNRPKRLELLPTMVDNLEALGRHAEALTTLRELKTLNDEAINADAQERIASLQGAIDLAERDRELAASEVERARQEASIAGLQAAEQRQRWLAYGLAFGVAGLTIVLGMLVRENRFRERTNRALAEKNREIESQRQHLQTLNQKVLQQSLRDELTQLPNRRFLNDYMQKQSATALSAPSQTLLLIIDIDHFKQINDSHGHLVGDQALVHLAGVLRSVQRGSDVMARWGGEEFLWLCPGLGLATAASLCERVRRALAEHPLVLADKTLSMKVSIGVAPLPLWPDRKGDWETSLRVADAALYIAKEEGRDRWAGLAGVEGMPADLSDESSAAELIASKQLKRL